MSQADLKNFANEIIKLTNTKQQVIYKPLPENDPLQRQPDITKAKNVLRWTPKVSRSEGLKRTYNYFLSLSQDELYKKEHNDFKKYIKN